MNYINLVFGSEDSYHIGLETTVCDSGILK